LKSVKTVLFDTEFSGLKSLKVALFNGDFSSFKSTKTALFSREFPQGPIEERARQDPARALVWN